MPSYQKVYYCKNCKKNVGIDDKSRCKKCGGNSFNVSWSTRFRISINGQEIQKRLSGFETKKTAQEAYLNYISTHQVEESKPIDLSFDTLYQEYKMYAKNRLKESSYYDFCSKCDLHIYDYFKDYLLKDITPKIILNWQETKHTFSYKYKRNLRNYLNAILNYAERYYKILNQLHFVDSFKKDITTQEMQIWTPEEFTKFINKVERPEYYAFFTALYYTGARKGELLATRWEDWDLKNGILNINKSLTKKVYGASWAITTPKNQTSVRKISIPKNLVDIMINLKQGHENDNFVFFGEKPLADSNVERFQKEACKKAKVKKIRIHDLRHSHASLLLSHNVSIVAVSKRLGHANTQQTLNTYAHLMPKEEDILVKILQETAINTVKNL